MSEFKINLSWKRATPDFDYKTYDRTHRIHFEGGQWITGSAAADFMGLKELANPEEMLAASASSCHMLTFLAVAAKSKFNVESYEDSAVAHLLKNAEGKLSVTQIDLHPVVKFAAGAEPDAAKLKELHEKAHANCFIANSIKSEVKVQL